MSRHSFNCIIILAFFLTANFLIMPYLMSDIAPSSGLTISQMAWGLGICNAIAALTLYLRPVFTHSARMLILIMLLIITGTGSVLAGMSNSLPWVLISGVGMMRISLVNFSDFNRQVHMQTNSEKGIKHALSTANVVSNVVSCAVPLAAAGILQKWGTTGLGIAAVILAFCSALLSPLLFTRKTSLRSISVSGKPSPVKTLTRFRKYSPLYAIVLMNAVIFAFIFSYIPLKIAQITPDKIATTQQYIALYFTVNSLSIVILSFPLLYLTEKMRINNKTIIFISTILSLTSIMPFIGYEGEFYRVMSSSMLMAISEILFIPFVVSFISSGEENEKEMILRDITFLSVSLSAALSAPVAGMLYHAGNTGLIFFCIAGAVALFFCVVKLKGSLK